MSPGVGGIGDAVDFGVPYGGHIGSGGGDAWLRGTGTGEKDGEGEVGGSDGEEEVESRAPLPEPLPSTSDPSYLLGPG
jgi:hypothetical protein